MPQIIVIAGGGAENGSVLLRERVNATDFESERFAANLLERLGWAVEDATAAEQGRTDAAEPTSAGEPDPDPGYAWDPKPLGVA
jgi:hypothetical protein